LGALEYKDHQLLDVGTELVRTKINHCTFALGHVLNFGSLASIIDCYSELCPLHEAVLAGNEPPALSPLPGLLGADLEVLAYQIRHGLGLNPTVMGYRQMFYMLANIHHQITTSEVLPLSDHV
jgi:hypothetical protein